MRRKIDYLIDLFVTIGVTAWIYFIINTFSIGKDTPPLIKAEIPQSTIDFFTGLVDSIDIGVRYNPEPDIEDWEKYDSITNMKTMEDSCFIVFYSAIDSIKEKAKAELALKYSNEAIPELERLMKDYPYPYEVNNRKLPIYLANSVENYSSIVNQLGIATTSSSSDGMYIYEISRYGTRALGVVISTKAWGSYNSTFNANINFKRTLWHELNHYVYFENYDFISNGEPYLWFTEGCAEYFAGAEYRLEEINKNTAKNFSFNSQNLGYESYWIGYTAFVCFDNNFGKDKLSDLIVASYNSSLKTAINNSNNIPLEQWEKNWKSFINNY